MGRQGVHRLLLLNICEAMRGCEPLWRLEHGTGLFLIRRFYEYK